MHDPGGVPGVLLVPGWDDRSQELYGELSAEFAELGWICRTINFPGLAWSPAQRETVTREDNLQEMLAAYDALAGHPGTKPNSIAIVGISYGGYLAAMVSAMRPLRWLALRAPALYRDEGWETPKEQLDKEDLAVYRQRALRPQDNRVLAACAAFRGDAFVIESEQDKTVAHPVIENYLSAFKHARSLTHRVLSGADHELSQEQWRQSYRLLLVSWMTEIAGRQGGMAAHWY